MEGTWSQALYFLKHYHVDFLQLGAGEVLLWEEVDLDQVEVLLWEEVLDLDQSWVQSGTTVARQRFRLLDLPL